jgi:hypothetical protein
LAGATNKTGSRTSTTRELNAMKIFAGGRYATAFCLVAGLSLAACTDSGTKSSGASSDASKESTAAKGPTIQGTWKLAEPTSSFKPVSGEVPYTAEGRAAYESNKANYDKGAFDEFDYAQSRCSSPGVPRLALTPYAFRIWVEPTDVVFQYQWNRLSRTVGLPGVLSRQGGGPGGAAGGPPPGGAAGAPPGGAAGRAGGAAGGPPGGGGGGGPDFGGTPFGTMVGQGKGVWDGDTLVITTTSLSGATLIDNLVPHGYDSKITERLRLTDKDTLEDHITIEDAEYFAKPWETVVTYKRQPNDPIPEDVCFDRLVSGQLPLPK